MNAHEPRMKRCTRCEATMPDTAEFFYQRTQMRGSLSICNQCFKDPMRPINHVTRRHFTDVIESIKPAIAELRRKGRL